MDQVKTVVRIGAEPVTVPYDDEGLRSTDLDAHPGTRAVLIARRTSSRAGWSCRPNGVQPGSRWADHVDGLILEDDSTQSSGTTVPGFHDARHEPRRVVLLGSLSRTLSPAIGIGWMLVPARWSDILDRVDSMPSLPPALDQLGLTRLLTSGAYNRHLRRVRRMFRPGGTCWWPT